MDYLILIPKKISGVRAWQALSPKCGTRGAHQTAMAAWWPRNPRKKCWACAPNL